MSARLEIAPLVQHLRPRRRHVGVAGEAGRCGADGRPSDGQPGGQLRERILVELCTPLKIDGRAGAPRRYGTHATISIPSELS